MTARAAPAEPRAWPTSFWSSSRPEAYAAVKDDFLCEDVRGRGPVNTYFVMAAR